MADTYKQVAVYEDEKAIVRVYRPVLTPEEYERRHKALEKAAADLIKSSMSPTTGGRAI